ncbi:MAG: hypothetical protein WDN06_23115 [Asticcacaulis sp.]
MWLTVRCRNADDLWVKGIDNMTFLLRTAKAAARSVCILGAAVLVSTLYVASASAADDTSRLRPSADTATRYQRDDSRACDVSNQRRTSDEDCRLPGISQGMPVPLPRLDDSRPGDGDRSDGNRVSAVFQYGGLSTDVTVTGCNDIGQGISVAVAYMETGSGAVGIARLVPHRAGPVRQYFAYTQRLFL